MMNTGKLARYYHTIKYLKFRQLLYRIFYACYKPSIQDAKTPSLRDWIKIWREPLWMTPSLSDGGHMIFLNEEACLDEASLWNNVKRSQLWLYHLHYFNDLNAKDAGERLNAAETMVQKWIDGNPPLKGIGWESYPVSLRIVNWIKWFSRYPDRVRPQWIDSLAIQADCLYQRIEHHILANHIVANAKALIFAGCFFDGQRADRWLRKGLRILQTEMEEQFLPDGGHFERSPMYHAILLWDICDVLNLASCVAIQTLDEHKKLWQKRITDGLTWLRLMTHPDGDISFFNDAAFCIAPTYQTILNYAHELDVLPALESGQPALNDSEPAWQLNKLEKSGYYVLTKGLSTKLILDVGDIGPDYQPGHAHADTLSFEFSVFNQRIVVNSGISQYGADERRHYQRSTKAHSTVCIDDQNSTDVWAGFRVAKRAKPFGLMAEEKEGLITVACSHDGYAGLPGKNIHRRIWQVRKEKLIVQDSISGYFNHAQARFYLHPSVYVISTDDKKIVCGLPTGETINLLLSGHGYFSVQPACWYPAFGVSEENVCILVNFLGHEITTYFEW